MDQEPIASRQDLYRALGRIEAKLDDALRRLENGDDRHQELESRVVSVERRMLIATGVVAALITFKDHILGMLK